MARLKSAEQIEQSYDLAMMALADYLAREQDAVTTIGARSAKAGRSCSCG